MHMSPSKKITSMPLQERVNAYAKEEAKIAEKYDIQKFVSIDFPGHYKIPLLGKFAMRILRHCKAVSNVRFTGKQ